MSRILIVLLLGCLVAFAAVADTPGEEIIYRVNLGRADDVALLLKKGASPDEKNDYGVPLLALAASRKDGECIDVMKALLDAGAHIDAKDSDGQTALFYAVKQSNKSAVKLLLTRGANYYAVDNSGNTARNLAYTSGQQDMGVAIDDFVKAQGAERQKQYEEWEKIVQERSKPQEPLPPQPTLTPLPPTPTPQPTPEPSPAVKPQPAPVNPQPVAQPPAAPTPEEQAAQKAAQEKRQSEINKLLSDMAFNNCAFQYWSYISDIGQSTELSPDALDDAIDSYKDKVAAINDQLIKDYGMKRWIIANISNGVKQRIFNELNAMPSKSYRHEQGVGKDDDMQSRCHAIARHWDKQSPAAPPARRGGMNGGMR